MSLGQLCNWTDEDLIAIVKLDSVRHPGSTPADTAARFKADEGRIAFWYEMLDISVPDVGDE
jgi:hypothetical protein